jgi:proteasome lid subunit RPN8/RPN11
MKLRISREHLSEIRQHGEAAYPNECCGFLLGRSVDGAKVVTELLRTENERSDSARNRYLISPEAYRLGEAEAERQGLQIIGFYHSHPDAPPRPSEFDREHALPWCSYVIVSVEGGHAKGLNAWVLAEDYSTFEQEEIEIDGG